MVFPEHDAGEQRQAEEHGRDAAYRDDMTPQELGCVVAPVAMPGAYRLAEQMPIKVIRKRLHGGIAPIRLFAHGHGDDGVQVAAQAGSQPLRRESAAIRDAAAIGVILAAQLGHHHLAGAQRVIHANRPLQLQLAVAEEPIRRTACHELVQQHAERINVCGRGDGPAEYLFGRGVLGSQNSFLQPSYRQGVRQAFRRQQLGYAEIQQLRRALVGDEDIGGFDVPVYYQVAMRVLHRGAHLYEQLEPFPNEQGAAVAIRVDGYSVDELHDQVRSAILEFTAVDQARNRRIVQGGENVPLAVQPAAQPRMQSCVL